MHNILIKLINKTEEKSIPFYLIFFSIISFAYIRNIIEHLIKNKSMYVANDFMTTLITYFFHFNFFWISIFFGLSLLLFLFVKQNTEIRAVLNISLFVFPIILLPPLFDLLIGDRNLMMYPNSPKQIIFDSINFLSFDTKLQGITTGMRIEIFTICVLFGVYIFIKTKRILRSIFGLILSYLIIVFHGIWLSFFAQIYEIGFNFTDNFNLATSKLFETGYVLRGSQSKISIVFILLSMFYLSIVFYFKNKKEFLAITAHLRFTRLFHYTLLMIFGIFIGKRLVLIHFFNDRSLINILKFENPFEYIGIFASILSMIFSFYSAVNIPGKLGQ